VTAGLLRGGKCFNLVEANILYPAAIDWGLMRHSSIALTMDTYGHLLPGQEVESSDRLGAMVSS